MFEKLKAMFNQPTPEPIVLGEDNRIIDFNKNQVFHGGCISCTSQKNYGIERCHCCQYQNSDWDKPDLSINDSNFHLGQWIENENNSFNDINYTQNQSPDKPDLSINFKQYKYSSLKSIKIINL